MSELSSGLGFSGFALQRFIHQTVLPGRAGELASLRSSLTGSRHFGKTLTQAREELIRLLKNL